MEAAHARRVARELQVRRSSQDAPLYFHGTSMLPLLREGDLVVIAPLAWSELAVGDIVTYRSSDKFPTRRIVRKSADEALVWSDNWPGVTHRVRRADILGRAERWLRDDVWIRASDPRCVAARAEAMWAYRRWALRRAAPAWLRAIARLVRSWRRAA
jgi:hypothetical protein